MKSSVILLEHSKKLKSGVSSFLLKKSWKSVVDRGSLMDSPSQIRVKEQLKVFAVSVNECIFLSAVSRNEDARSKKKSQQVKL